MKHVKTLFFVLILFLLGTTLLQARGWKKIFALRTPNAAAQSVAKTSDLVTKITRQTALKPLENNIHHFIFTVTPRGQKDGFKTSGFVFAHNNTLWGASASHALRHMGKDVTVTFHANGKEQSFPATVELTGRSLGLNAALIKLPEEVAQVAQPFELATEAQPTDATVFTYGFSAGKYKKTVRPIVFPGEERLLVASPMFGKLKPGSCGSAVINEKGKVVGIEVGGYDARQTSWFQQTQPHFPFFKFAHVSEVVPAYHLNLLLKEYYTPHAADRNILFLGQQVGILQLNEFVSNIYVRYQDGSFRFFNRNPLWNLANLDALIPNLEQAKTVGIRINRDRDTEYFYIIDMNTHTITRED